MRQMRTNQHSTAFGRLLAVTSVMLAAGCAAAAAPAASGGGHGAGGGHAAAGGQGGQAGSAGQQAGSLAAHPATPTAASVRPARAHRATLPAASGTTVPGAPNCPMFPADNIWNTDISKLPVDSHSAAWMRSMNSGSTFLHPDFGPSGGFPYGIPFTIVTSAHRLVHVRFQYAGDSDRGPYPLGPDTKIEGGKTAGGDRHAVIVNKSTCVLYELWNTHYSRAGSRAGSGAIWHLRSDALRPAGFTSADAAGLPIFPGLLEFGQVQWAVRTGRPIRHAIRFTAERTRTAFIWPARHEAGSSGSASLPPMGARFRLKGTYNIAGFCRNSTPYCRDAKVVLTEMKHYGLILADNGSNWFFQGTAFPQWPDALVELLKRIPARSFQAVNTSCLMVSRNSGQARPHAGCP
jgi:hypothetical protein